jgi:hypothetical protein
MAIASSKFLGPQQQSSGSAGWQPADVGQLADEISAAKKIFGELSKKTG